MEDPGPQSSSLWLKGPCSSQGMKLLLGQEAKQASRADRNCSQMASLWAWALGEELFAGPVARASQGSHMLPTSWRAGHRPPQQPDAPGPVCGSKASPSGGGAAWLFPAGPPGPAGLAAPKSRVSGLCQQGAVLHCPSGMRHCGLERTSGLCQPPQPGHLWPHGTQWQGQPEPGKGHASLCARQVADRPQQGLSGPALAWPGGRERGRGQGPWASPVGPGR